MSKCERIFIVGHPGAGKALLAKKLAETLGWQFVDAYFGLEARMGRQLPELLGLIGEKAFLACQGEALKALVEQTHIVVTIDASIVSDEQNRKWLSMEFVVNLQVGIDTQLARLAKNPTPLLLKAHNLQAFLNQLHQTRDSLYEEVATLSLSSDDNALEEHVSTVIQYLGLERRPWDNASVAMDDKDLMLFHKKLHSPVHLTRQQAVCLKLLAQGLSAKEIAKTIQLSYRTVEGNIAKMMVISGCESSKELIALYYDNP